MLFDELIEIEKNGARERAEIRRKCDADITEIRRQKNEILLEIEAEHEKQMAKMNYINEQIKAATEAKDFKRVQELFKDLMAQMKA